MQTRNADALSYGDQCAIGRSRADEMIAKMREESNPLLLAAAVKEVGELTPVQIGFFSRVACMLIAH